MKLQKRINELENTVDELKTEWTEYGKQRNKKNLEGILETKLINDRAKVDWQSAASVIKHYVVSDISRLLPVAEPHYAGPLWYLTLNAMSAIAGLCYGFGNIKRSFMKFVIQNMELKEPLAELLYVGRKAAHLGIFPANVMINAKTPNGDMFLVHEDRIIVDISILAKEFLRVLELIDYRAMKQLLPIALSERDIQSQALEYLRNEGNENVD